MSDSSLMDVLVEDSTSTGRTWKRPDMLAPLAVWEYTMALENRIERLEAVVELTARTTDSSAPGDVRKRLKRYRVKPFTSMSTERLEAICRV